MVLGILPQRVQGKQFMDQVEVKFGGAPVVFAGEYLGNFSADNGMKSETIKIPKELDRFQIDIGMVSTGVEKPTWLPYRKNGIKENVTQNCLLEINHCLAQAYPSISRDHSKADDRHEAWLCP